jgi:hypothetical protein
MEGTGAVAMPRRAKNIDMKNPPWNKKIYVYGNHSGFSSKEHYAHQKNLHLHNIVSGSTLLTQLTTRTCHVTPSPLPISKSPS